MELDKTAGRILENIAFPIFVTEWPCPARRAFLLLLPLSGPLWLTYVAAFMAFMFVASVAALIGMMLYETAVSARDLWRRP